MLIDSTQPRHSKIQYNTIRFITVHQNAGRQAAQSTAWSQKQNKCLK